MMTDVDGVGAEIRFGAAESTVVVRVSIQVEFVSQVKFIGALDAFRERWMSTYRAAGNALYLLGGQEVRFPYDIQSAMCFGDIVVVVLDVPRGVQFNRNVYGVTMSGDIRWQIADVFRVPDHGPLGGLAARGDRAFLGSWSGVAIILDPATGRVIQEIMQQR